VRCLLHEGLDTGTEVSKAVYETVLDELGPRDKPWQLGNYEILEQIGCGGMGVIYRARQRHSRRIVAVKRVLSYRADSHGALERFRREAQAIASLDHPNILPIYEVNESEDGLPFFSMKFAENGSLHENVASLRDEPRKCVQLMAKVARAVEYAHSRGVLHRDIKPGNILLSERGEPLVSDFGLAKLLDGNNDLTRSLTTFGTAGFIAPEQAGGAAADFRPAADVYSLGAVLFNLFAGRPPFLGSNPVSVIRKASETRAPKLRSLVPALDRDLETVCARCLERDPKARYQSAGDLAADLERWLDGRPIIARPVSPPARIWRWSRRNPKLVGAATAGLLLGAAAVWLLEDKFARSIVDALEIKLAAQVSAYEQPVRVSTQKQAGNGMSDIYQQRLFTNVTDPVGLGSFGISVPRQSPSNPLTVADHVSPGSFDSPRPNTELTAATPGTPLTTDVRDRAPEAGLPTNKITADVTAAPPKAGFGTNVRDRASEAGLRNNKIIANATPASPRTGITSSVHDRELESDLRTNKITADARASIQGFVKDAKGEPVKGAALRIESRDGKQLLTTVKTDPNGRYVSQGLQPGVYRVTLVMNGAVKASIMNTQTTANQPTRLNFDLKQTPQASNIAKNGKHMVWVPNRTGTHIGGNWVEVDDEGNAHFDSNIQTYSVRR
jgi:tRNA A-37 threonylcarbamoyl transferase component Bud32